MLCNKLLNVGLCSLYHNWYKFLRFLRDTQLEHLVQTYNRWYHGEYLHKVFQGDFYALPNKIPHGPIANARPVLNFTTIWKVFSACLKQFLTPILCAAHAIPPSQFALHGGASAIDTLRVIHDHILDRWFVDLLVCMVFDDVTHAFGSVQHHTLEGILRLLHFPSHLIYILMNAATGATLHMGGKNGIAKGLPNSEQVLHKGAQCQHSCFVSFWNSEFAWFCMLFPTHNQNVEILDMWLTWMIPLISWIKYQTSNRF